MFLKFLAIAALQAHGLVAPKSSLRAPRKPATVVAARGGGGGEHVRPLAPEVMPVLEEPVAVVLVEDVPVLPRVALVLLDPKLMT